MLASCITLQQERLYVAERLVPIGDRVLIEPVEPPSQIGRIVVPDAHKDKPTRGKVGAVGETVEQVKVGDIVVYGKYSGTDIEVNGKEVVLMHESDIIAVVKVPKPSSQTELKL